MKKTKKEKIKIAPKPVVIKSVCLHEAILPSDDWTYIKCAICGEKV